MQTRHPHWQEISNYSKIFNFKWKPFSSGIRFDQLSLYGQKQLVNHIVNHEEITMKHNMFKNLSEYCKENSLDVFQYVPLTFMLEYDSEDICGDLSFFSILFDVCNEVVVRNPSVTKEEIIKYMNEKLKRTISENLKYFNIDKIYHNLKIPNTHINSSNMWFLKVTKLNRGRGIYVFNTIEQLISLINDCTESLEGTTIIRNNEEIKCFAVATKNKKYEFFKVPTLVCNRVNSNTDDVDSNCVQNSNPKYKCSTFVIQKYIERPLLIFQRKFDIRIWVLFTQDKVYLFKEGYIRTASETFSIKESDITKPNNSNNYGEFEDGNQLSFKQLEQYIQTNYDGDFQFSQIIDQMKETITLSFKSIQGQIENQSANLKNSCFELFGYDFMIDQSLKAWLIEINTNPCIEESSKLLESYIPRVIDDALKLTIDVAFKIKKSNEESYVTTKSCFHVDGYADEENLWDLIYSI